MWGIAQRTIRLAKEEGPWHLLAVGAIVGLAAGLRLYFLSQPMRYDESYTFLLYASKPLRVGLSDYSAPNNHLFHTFLVHLAYLLWGNEPWVLRLPALIAGTLLAPAAYAVGRIFYNRHAGLIAAGLVASSSALIEYSTNARGYTLVCLVFLVILSLGRYLINGASMSAWLVFAVLSAVGFHTIPIMMYPFGIVTVWISLSIILKQDGRMRGALLKRLAMALLVTVVLTLVLYRPVLMRSGPSSVVANSFVMPMSWLEFARGAPASVSAMWSKWNRDIPLVLEVLLAAGCALSLLFHKRICSQRVPVVLAAVVWLVPVLVVQRVIPPERVWLFLLPLYLTLAAAGLVYFLSLAEPLFGRHFSVMLAVFAIGLSLLLGWNVVERKSVYFSEDTGALRDAEEIAGFLKGYLRPGDRVLAACPADGPLRYYLIREGVSPEYLWSASHGGRRVLVVVKQPSQTLQELLETARLPLSASHVLLKRYESASLYEINLPTL